MTDDLDRLRKALAQAPQPDAEAKARAMTQAMENFDRAQGSARAPRQGKDRPRGAGFLNGVRFMSNFLSSRAFLATSGSVAALGLVLVAVLPLSKHDVSDAIGLSSEPMLADPVAADAAAGRQAVPAPSAKMADESFGQIAMPSPAEPLAAPPLPDAPGLIAPDTEAFANAPENPLRITAEQPVSTFSIDVDTASYAIVRSSLEGGRLPLRDAVRVEEMVNYFPYAYPAPAPGEAPFRPTVTVMPTPWNPGTQLVHIALQGRTPAIKDRPPLNLVFLIDTSGSMQSPDKLPLLKQSLGLMLGRLSPADQVAIVTYAGSAGEVLQPMPASDRQAILNALGRLEAGGATAGEDGIRLAYRTAAAMAATGEVSRVILATDGDFNLGLADPAELAGLIARERDSGTYLSVLGFGRGNLDDATMQALAQNGNGRAAYVDRLGEAQKVLVDQVSGALFPIADDVKVQVEWNPAQVAEYRLIGYETRALAREDFANDGVDAGEIGAGHSVTAIYEITPADSPARLTDPLRYGSQPAGADRTGELGFLRLRYKAPGESRSALIETPIPAALTTDPGDDTRFAAAIAGFGQLLRGGAFTGDWTWGDAIALADSARGADPFGYRIEAVTLMRLAESLSR